MGGGSSTATIVIQTERPYYSAGEIVNGKVYLNATEETDAESLQVTVWGRERTCVRYTKSTGTGKNKKTRTHYARATRDLLTVDYTAATFPGCKVQKGSMFEFPIQFQLPPGLPSTMSHAGPSNCDIKYGISARLHTTGWFTWDVRASASIVVQRTPHQIMANVPMYAQPNMQEVNFCCCFNQGSMCLGANASSSILTRGSPIQVGLACKNQSSTAIEGVRISIQERVSFKAGAKSSVIERPVASASLDPKAISGTAALEQKQKQTAGNNNVLQNIVHQLQSGAAAALVNIALDARDSYSGMIVNVDHFIAVELLTGQCITNPAVTMPLTIQPMFLGGAEPGAPPAAALPPPPLLQDMRAEPDERPVPMQMPQGWAPQNQGQQMVSIPIPAYSIKGATTIGGEDDEDDNEPDFLANAARHPFQAMAEQAGPPATIPQLLAELDHTFDDVGSIRSFSMRPESRSALAALTPDDVKAVLQKIMLPSFRVDGAVLLLSKVPGGPTCVLVAAAARGTGDLYDSQTVQQLAPFVAPQELAANRNVILDSLSEFDKLVCGPALGL